MSDFITISYRGVEGKYFPSIVSDEAMTGTGMEDVVGVRFHQPHIGVRRNGMFQRFWSMLDMVTTRDKLVKLQANNNTIPSYTIQVQNHFNSAKNILSKNLAGLTDQELLLTYKKVCAEYRDICNYAYTANLLDRPVSETAKQGLSELTPDTNDTTTNEYLLMLTRNPAANFLYNHDLELIEILVNSGTEAEITEHIDKWKALFNGGNDNNGAQDIKERISTFSNLDKDGLLKKKAEIQSQFALAESEINRIEGELKIPEELKKTFAILRDCILLKETRKFCMTRLEDLIFPLFESIGKRINIKSDNVAFLLPVELKSALLRKDGTITNDKIEAFKDDLCWVIQDGKAIRFIGSEVDEVINKYSLSDEIKPLVAMDSGQPSTQGVVDFKGFVSCLGYAKGSVKIVLGKSDFGKVHPGDILITPITTPEYIAIFDKIKGMVTFDGAGLTSHPATLSREYKIPAILGVKDLDGVLHDYDIIEVDANNNKVKIIRSA